jgi:hypothetical protein
MYLILTHKVIEGDIVGISGVIIFCLIDKIENYPLVEKIPRINHLIMILNTSSYVAFALVVYVIMVKVASNLVLLEIFGGGLIGAMLSIIIIGNKNVLKPEKQYTKDDVLLSVILFLGMFTTLVIATSI